MLPPRQALPDGDARDTQKKTLVYLAPESYIFNIRRNNPMYFWKGLECFTFLVGQIHIKLNCFAFNHFIVHLGHAYVLFSDFTSQVMRSSHTYPKMPYFRAWGTQKHPKEQGPWTSIVKKELSPIKTLYRKSIKHHGNYLHKMSHHVPLFRALF